MAKETFLKSQWKKEPAHRSHQDLTQISPEAAAHLESNSRLTESEKKSSSEYAWLVDEASCSCESHREGLSEDLPRADQRRQTRINHSTI